MKSLLLILFLFPVLLFAQEGSTSPRAKTDEEILTFVDEPAEFPGGVEAMRRYLAETIHYPDSAVAHKITGKCYLRFVVETSGEITDVTVIRKIDQCPECGIEAVKAVQAMPRWKPARNGGKVVRTFYNLPVNFSL